ncbi:MAG: hypothetical protein KC493_14865, partial [Bacteriovoracaceae bacterium]|nr:hypothetical protein [Bacteriovoracaceae bacterium]
MGTLFSSSELFAQDQKEETSKNPTDAKDSKPTGKKKKEKKKPYISIAKPKIKNISDLQQRLIIRSAIGVVMKSGKFNMLFSSPKSFEDAKFKFYKLEMSGGKTKWGKNKSGYNLKFKLVDAFTKKTIREVIKTRIEGRQLVFKSKLLQWELIFGKDKAKEVEKEVEAQAEEEILEEEKEKDDKNKDNKKDSSGDSAGVGDPPPPPVDPEDENSEEILAEEEKKKKKKLALEEEEKKKKKKKKKDLKISEFDSPDLDLTKEKLDTTVQPPKPFKVDSQIAFGLDFIEESISSKDIIEV